MHFLNPLAILGVCTLIVFGAFIFPIPDQILSQVAQTAGGPTFYFSPDSYSVEEGKKITIKIKANGPIYQTTRIKLQIQAGTASSRSDFAPLTSTVTFYRGGLTTKSITFRTNKDVLVEGEETATIKIISINGVSASQAATITIFDVGTTGGNTTVTTCATNEPCDKFDPWRPFSSKSVGGVMYQQKSNVSFTNQGALVSFTGLSVNHPKVGNVLISGKFNQPWSYSNTLFAPGNTRNIAIPTGVLGIFSLTIPTNSPDYPTKTWTYEYINDTPTNAANGAGLPMRVVSKIPGDFNPNNVPSACRRTEPIGYGSMVFSIDPEAKNLPGVCYLVPGQRYYVNYLYATIEYSDASAYERERIGLITPWRPPTNPLVFEGNGKTARVVDTNNCAGDDGTGPKFPSFCEQLWVMRDLRAGTDYVFIGSQETDPAAKCNEFAPRHPGKKVYITTNTNNTVLSKLYRCDSTGPVLVPRLDTNL